MRRDCCVRRSRGVAEEHCRTNKRVEQMPARRVHVHVHAGASASARSLRYDRPCAHVRQRGEI